MLGRIFLLKLLLLILETQRGLSEDLDHDDDENHQHVNLSQPRGKEESLSQLNITTNCTLTVWPLTVHRTPRNFVNIHKLGPLGNNNLDDPIVLTGDMLRVLTQCSCCQQSDYNSLKARISKGSGPLGKIYLRIRSSNKYAVNVVKAKTAIQTDSEEKHESHEETIGEDEDDCGEESHCLEIYSRTQTQDKFYLDMTSIGKSRISVDLVWVNDTRSPLGGDTSDIGEVVNSAQIDKMYRVKITSGMYLRQKVDYALDPQSNVLAPKSKINRTMVYSLIKPIEAREIDNETKWTNSSLVIVLLKPRSVNLAFDIGALLVVCMGVMSVGCCNYKDEAKLDATSSLPIIFGVLIQTVVIPMIGLGLSIVFRLKSEVALGLFVTSCLPGGGLAHLLVFLAQGNRFLSKYLSLLVIVVNMFTATGWILSVGYIKFGVILNWYRLIFWLFFIASTQILTTVLNKYTPSCTRFLLTWFTRPLLLLAGIFLITLGVYINHYVFHHVSKMLLLSLLILITISFVIGYLFGVLTGCRESGAKTFSTEFSVFNGLFAIVILRTCLHGPEGDLASMVPLWASFFTPVPWVYHEIIKMTKTSFNKHIRKNHPMMANLRSISNLNLSELYSLQPLNENTMNRESSHENSIFATKKIIPNKNVDEISLVIFSDSIDEASKKPSTKFFDKINKKGKVI